MEMPNPRSTREASSISASGMAISSCCRRKESLRDPAAHRRPCKVLSGTWQFKHPVQWQHLPTPRERKELLARQQVQRNLARIVHMGSGILESRFDLNYRSSSGSAPNSDLQLTPDPPRDRGDHERDRPQRRGLARAVWLVGQHDQDGELQLDRQAAPDRPTSRPCAWDRGAPASAIRATPHHRHQAVRVRQPDHHLAVG